MIILTWVGYALLGYVALGLVVAILAAVTAFVYELTHTVDAKYGLNYFLALLLAVPFYNIGLIWLMYGPIKEPKRQSWEEIEKYITPKSKEELEAFAAEHPELEDELKQRNEFTDTYKSDYE